MIFARPRIRILALLSLLVLISCGTGFIFGLMVSGFVAKKKEEPSFWKQAAMKHLEKLKPTDDQRKKFETHTDAAVKELADMKKQAIKEIWRVINDASSKIEQELTPSQKEQFDKIRPREKSDGSK